MNNTGITIKQLYPELTEAEAVQAVEAIDDYLRVVVKIHRRLQLQQQAECRPEVRTVAGPGLLTEKFDRSTMPVSKVESY